MFSLALFDLLKTNQASNMPMKNMFINNRLNGYVFVWFVTVATNIGNNKSYICNNNKIYYA
jgi:hypothetical protein